MKLSALHTELLSNGSALQPAVQHGKVINLQSRKSKTTSLQLSLSFGFQAPLFPLRIYWTGFLEVWWHWEKDIFSKKINVILILLLETILRFAIKATISYLNSIFSGETVSQEYQSLKISISTFFACPKLPTNIVCLPHCFNRFRSTTTKEEAFKKRKWTTSSYLTSPNILWHLLTVYYS